MNSWIFSEHYTFCFHLGNLFVQIIEQLASLVQRLQVCLRVP